MATNFFINLKSSDMIYNGDGTYSFNLQIPELQKYNRLRVVIQNCMVVRSSFSGNDNVYNINSSLRFNNSYDSSSSSSFNNTILACVPYSISHFTSKGNNALELNGTINGYQKFWITDFTGTILQPSVNYQPQQTTNNYVGFQLTMIVSPYE